jgi:site-specific DNA recombinase
MEPVVAYIRISDPRQGEASPETQRQCIQDFASGHQLKVVRFFEEAHSARTHSARGAFDDMLDFLREHPGIRTVVVYKLDRLWRNETDYGAFRALDDARILSATEEIPEGSTGRFLTTMYMAVATLESDKTSERVRDSAIHKVRSGGWPGPAPTGYVNNTVAKTIEPDPVMGPIVTRTFETYAYEPISLSELVKRARQLGLRTRYGGVLGKGALHHLITNPFYYGTMLWCGKLYPGNHEPLVTKALFDRVQERLQGKATPRGQTRTFPFRGLLSCRYCGCQLTAEIKKGKYVYYHCTQSRGKCEQPWHRQEALAERLRFVVDGAWISREIVDELLRQLQDEGEERRRMRRAQVLQLKSEEQRLINQRQNVYLDKAEGEIEESFWSGLDERLRENLAAVQGEIERLSSTREPDVDNTRRTLELLERGPELYSLESPEDQARHIRWLASNCVVSAENVVPTYREPFASVAMGKETGDWLPG